LPQKTPSEETEIQEKGRKRDRGRQASIPKRTKQWIQQKEKNYKLLRPEKKNDLAAKGVFMSEKSKQEGTKANIGNLRSSWRWGVRPKHGQS